MSELTVAGVYIIGGLLVGYLLSRRFYSESRALESMVRIPFNLMWVLAGIFTILGGYRNIGAIILAVWFFFFVSNTRRVREEDFTVKTSGWRRKVGNWNPYGGRD